MTDEKLNEITKGFECMSVEEYIDLYDKARGYSDADIPVSDFCRIVHINKCSDCPHLNNRGEYMVTSYYECDKTKQKTSETRSESMTLEMEIQLYHMFEKCTFLVKEK